MEPRPKEQLDYLDQLSRRVLTLNEELKRAATDQDWERFEEHRRSLQKLKEEYRRLTGLYPNV